MVEYKDDSDYSDDLDNKSISKLRKGYKSVDSNEGKNWIE